MHARQSAAGHAEGEDTAGATLLITGCPGTGKSAFLTHFADLFPKPDATGTVLIPVQCGHQELTARNATELEAQLTTRAIASAKGWGKTGEVVQTLVTDVAQRLRMKNTVRLLTRKSLERLGKRTVISSSSSTARADTSPTTPTPRRRQG